MSGEDIHPSENEQPLDEGYQSLADMPSFQEHMTEHREKTFDEARRDGELPDGVRDEQDYQEYIAEQKAHKSETTEKDKALLAEIDGVKDHYDKDLLMSLIPTIYNDNGEKQASEKEYDFNVLSLALDFIKSGDESINEFIDRKNKEKKQQLEDRGLDYKKSEYIEESNQMYYSLNKLKKHLRHTEIQEETDDNTETVMMINEAIKNDDGLAENTRSWDYNLVEDLARFRTKISSDPKFLSSAVPDERHRYSLNEPTTRPEFDKGIATIMARELLQQYQSTDSKIMRREMRSTIEVLSKYCGGQGFNQQMNYALNNLREGIYTRAVKSAEEEDAIESDFASYRDEKRRLSTGDISNIMAIYRVSGEFSAERNQHADYLDNIQKGKSIFEKLRS